MPSSIGEALDLVEHRGVRRVELVGAEDPSRAHHVDRRLLRSSIVRTCTGEVWVRSTRPRVRRTSTKNVSCIVRAGWSGPMLSASKLNHSASTSGPSATSQPIATNTSADPLDQAGERVPGPARAAVARQRDVDGLLDQHPASRSASSSAWRASSADRTRPRAAPTRWPASALAAGGSAPISRLASASGERSPAWRQPDRTQRRRGRPRRRWPPAPRRPPPPRRQPTGGETATGS